MITLGITGAAKTKAKFRAIGAATGNTVPDALERAGILVRNRTEARAPRLSGDLAGSVYSTSPEKKDGFYDVYVGVGEDYSRFQEFGTKRHGAQSHLGPALEESKPEIRAMIIKAAISSIK